MNKIFSEIELRRYAKQIGSPEIGLRGQEKLKKSKVLVIGAGSIGVPALQYLAAAGVGVLGICDYQTIEESDFPTQIMYGLGDLGKLKTIVAKEKIQLLNPFVSLQIHNIQLRPENVRLICEGYDLIIDCTNDVNVVALLLQQTHMAVLTGRTSKQQGEIWIFPQGQDRSLPEKNNLTPAESVIWGSMSGITGCMLAYLAIQTILSDYQTSEKQFCINFATFKVK